MITAHLPSGYVLGRTLASGGPVLGAALIGAVLPDFDLIWFYLIDNRAVHHHAYWVHIPACWAVVAAGVLPLVWLFKRAWLPVAGAFFAGLLLHLCLDTIAGDIKWLWPWRDQFYHLVTVPPGRAHWVLNFLLHPVMVLELAIWAAALWLWVGRKRAVA